MKRAPRSYANSGARELQFHAGQDTAKWFNGLIRRLNALAENPEQYSVARESEFLPIELRQLLYGSGKRLGHRVLFVIREQRIVVYQIRHVSMQDIKPEDLG